MRRFRMVWRSPILHCGRRAYHVGICASVSRADCEGRRGYRRAQAIASYADGLSENGGESRFRVFFIAYGFPVPELQAEFRDPLDPSPGVSRRLFLAARGRDVCHRRARRKGEVHLAERRGPGVGRPIVAERQRESHLTMLGHKVLRFTFNELKDPGKLVEKMRLAGIPRRPDLAEEWRRQWYGR